MSADTPAKDQDKFVLRLPDGMRDRLKAAAEANKRSMNAEIIDRLELTFDLASEVMSDPAQVLMEQLKKSDEKQDAARREYEAARREYEEAKLAAERQARKTAEVETILAHFQDVIALMQANNDEERARLRARLSEKTAEDPEHP
ncbi:multidrug efflux pump subunit AcrA (membrane-fusion protein) [Methylobacterium sp. RAS18]|nr:multidrug efflux pump subunit AcrA (membrane-fusion protein) [Methylobacterium sp. RAS18]